MGPRLWPGAATGCRRPGPARPGTCARGDETCNLRGSGRYVLGSGRCYPPVRKARARASACSRVATSPAYWPPQAPRSSSPSRGPSGMPSAPASSSPRQQRRGGPPRAPAQRIGEHRAREAQVRLDRLTGAIAAGGETVGDRQQRHVHLDRLAGRAGRRTPCAAPAAGARGRGSRGAGGGARARPRGRAGARSRAGARAPRRASSAPRASWPMNVTRPSRRGGRARERLGGVVQQRPPAQRLAARELVGERLGQQRGERLGELAGAENGARVGLQGDRAVEHLERVTVHVAVVEAALLHAAQRLAARAAPPR